MNRTKIILCVVALALMAGGAGMILRLKASQRLGQPGVVTTKGAAGEEVALPRAVLNYQPVEVTIAEEERRMLPADTCFGRRVYRAADGFEALISVVLMGSDRTSIHKPQFCLTGQGWKIEQTERTTIPIERPQAYELPVLKLTATKTFQKDGHSQTWRGLYVYWFVTDGQLSNSDWERMGSMAGELMRTGTLQRWAYVSYFATCPPGREADTFKRMEELITLTVPTFQTVPAGRVAEAGIPLKPWSNESTSAGLSLKQAQAIK